MFHACVRRCGRRTQLPSRMPRLLASLAAPTRALRRPPSSLSRCLRAAVEEAKLGGVEGPGTPPSRRRRTEAQAAAERDDHTGVVRVLETAQEAVRASAPGMAEDATCAALWGKLSNLGTRVAEFEGIVPLFALYTYVIIINTSTILLNIFKWAWRSARFIL